MSETRQEYQKKKMYKKIRKNKKLRKELNSQTSFSSIKNQTRRSSYVLSTEEAKILEERTTERVQSGSPKSSLKSPVSSNPDLKQKENKEDVHLGQQPCIFSTSPSQPRVSLKNYEKRLTTVISRDLHSNPSTKFSSVKLQNYLHPPVQSTTMLPTFGDGKSSLHSPGIQGEGVTSLLFSPSHPRMHSDLITSPTKTMLASSDRLGITSTHNFASIEGIEHKQRRLSFKQSQLQQLTRERLRDLITNLADQPLSRQEQIQVDSSVLSHSFSGRGGGGIGYSEKNSPLKIQPQSIMHSPRQKMMSMHRLFKIGKKCKLNMRRLRMDLLREEVEGDIINRAQKIKKIIARRADTSDPEVREVVKSLDSQKVLKKRRVGSFLYSDDSIQELKNNDSKRLASLGKIKHELFLYGAKCSLATSKNYRYRAFLPQA